jgi:hypothetical protein
MNREDLKGSIRELNDTFSTGDLIVLIIMRKSADECALDSIKEFLISRNFDIHQSTGANRTIIGVIGDTEILDIGKLESMNGVLQVIRIAKEEQ